MSAPSQPAPIGHNGGPSWYAGIQDESLKKTIEAKGWKGIEDVVRGYQSAEQLIGGKLDGYLEKPKDGDPASWGKVYDALGRPKTPDEYKVPEGFEITDADGLKKIAHKYGIPAAKFGDMVQDVAKLTEATEAAKGQAYDLDLKSTVDTLRSELGPKFAGAMAAGNTAMMKLGLAEADVVKMGEAIGVERVTRLLINIGQSVVSDSGVGLGSGQSAGMSKANAQAEINRITTNNPEFVKSLTDPMHPAHKANSERWSKLLEVAHSN